MLVREIARGLVIALKGLALSPFLLALVVSCGVLRALLMGRSCSGCLRRMLFRRGVAGVVLSGIALVAGACVKQAYSDVLQSFDTCGTVHACDGRAQELVYNVALTVPERNELLSRMCLETKTPAACHAACAALPEDKEKYLARGCAVSGTWCLQAHCDEHLDYDARLARYGRALEAEEESLKNEPVPLALIRTGAPAWEAWPVSISAADAVKAFSFACKHGVADGCKKQRWIEDPAQATRDCETDHIACEIARATVTHSSDAGEILRHAAVVCGQSDSACDALIQAIATRGTTSPVAPADLALAVASSCADVNSKKPACKAARLLTPDQALAACTKSLSACMRSRGVVEKKLRRPLPATCAAGSAACPGEVAGWTVAATLADECKSAPATCRSAQVEAFLQGRPSVLDAAIKAGFGQYFSTLMTTHKVPDESVVNCAKLPEGYGQFCEKIRPQMLARMKKLLETFASCMPQERRYEGGCGDAVVERTTTTLPDWANPFGGVVTRYEERKEHRCTKAGYLEPTKVQRDCAACVQQLGVEGGAAATGCAALSRD